MLNENVKKLLKENMWDLATCSAGVPNAVPVAFKDVTDDGKLVVGDVFLDTTLRNLAANDGRIARFASGRHWLQSRLCRFSFPLAWALERDGATSASHSDCSVWSAGSAEWSLTATVSSG